MLRFSEWSWLATNGGISAIYSPLDIDQFTDKELAAVAFVAESFDSYFMVHAHCDNAVSRAIDFGAKSIEHGHLMTASVIKRMAEEGVYLGQPMPLVAGTRLGVFEILAPLGRTCRWRMRSHPTRWIVSKSCTSRLPSFRSATIALRLAAFGRDRPCSQSATDQ